MSKLKNLIILLVIPMFAFTSIHKFYVSVTQVDFIKEKGEVQITSRIFIDDLERLIRERYDESITLTGENESGLAEVYIEKYLKEKIGFVINGVPVKLNYLGKEYEDDIAICYLEIYGIEAIRSIEISNSVLFDIFEEQQNVIRTKINSKKKSFILVQGNDKGLLNFD
ncbi:MAG: peptidase E [Bacteroidia bacterium]|nr:peptidase E [Bacteroidia bacterium]NND10156.1 peptidase E [Flavobacteriaceae bacterium]NNK28421.1 peptidase E [Flavobacteriaceae bacterium]